MDRSEDEYIELWQSFIDWIDERQDSTWKFRGLGDLRFELIPKIGRLGKHGPRRIRVIEQAMLSTFRDKLLQIRDVETFSIWDLMALGQHHGIPTRLLDWTANPLVAAYFAVTSEPSYSPHKTADGESSVEAKPRPERRPARIVAVNVLSSDMMDRQMLSERDFSKGIFPFTGEAVRFFEPRSVTERIVTQGGLFGVHSDPTAPWEPPGLGSFRIPGWARGYFQSRLFQLGIDAQRIMGGLDGLCAKIAWDFTERPRRRSIQ